MNRLMSVLLRAERCVPACAGMNLGRTLRSPSTTGCSVRAGMDRARRSSGSRSVGLPRTRGDGPVTTPSVIGRGRAAPHARGWTRLRHQDPQEGRGCPVRAGMDPTTPAARACPSRLPPRGDGPAWVLIAASVAAAAPHARGRTSVLVGVARADLRCPVCGDGPWANVTITIDDLAAPHARG